MPPYDQSVFINCPFDTAYKPLFNVIVFAVRACGFVPRCALEVSDANDIRIQKIMATIRECQYGIHDISLPDARMNMPLELGLFMGCREYGSGRQKQKKYLVLEKDAFSSKKYLSDLSGQDIAAHENKSEKIIEVVRNWLVEKAPDPLAIPHPSYLIEVYKRFELALSAMCAKLKWTIPELKFTEYLMLLNVGLSNPAIIAP